MRRIICIFLAVFGCLCLGALEAGDAVAERAQWSCEEISADDSAQAGLWCKRVYNSDLHVSRLVSAPHPRVMGRHEYRPASQNMAQRVGMTAVATGMPDMVGIHAEAGNLFADTHPRGYYLHELRRLII